MLTLHIFDFYDTSSYIFPRFDDLFNLKDSNYYLKQIESNCHKSISIYTSENIKKIMEHKLAFVSSLMFFFFLLIFIFVLSHMEETKEYFVRISKIISKN